MGGTLSTKSEAMKVNFTQVGNAANYSRKRDVMQNPIFCSDFQR